MPDLTDEQIYDRIKAVVVDILKANPDNFVI